MVDLSIKQSVKPPKISFSVTTGDRVIGVVNPGYGYERVSYSLSPDRFRYACFKSLPLHRILDRDGSFFHYTPIVLGTGASLLHTWNALPISTMPFVVSYECELPRYLGTPARWQKAIGKRILESSRCRRILALSEAAKNVLANQHGKNTNVLEKIEVFRGGVVLPVTSKDEYSVNGAIQLLFIGTDAIRKGIYPLLIACEMLRNSGVEVELTIVGGFSLTSYVHKSCAPDTGNIENKIETLDWVFSKGKLSQLEVLKSILETDVVVFPTFDESLGWVPIEAGLLGVPTIATNIFAIPELIDHLSTGYLIDLNKRSDQRFAGLDKDGEELGAAIDKANQNIVTGLIKSISYLYYNRHIIQEWGNAAKVKMTEMYGIGRAERAISNIYESCLL